MPEKDWLKSTQKNGGVMIKNLRSKKKKIDKLAHELECANLSKLIGKKVKLTGSCIEWYKEFADDIGMSYEEMEIITSKPKPVGIIEKARYNLEDGFTVRVKFDGLTMRVGINDINEVR